MLAFVIGGLAATGGAVFLVLNQAISRDRRRNRQVAASLIAVSSVLLVAGLVYGMAGWL